MTAAVEGSVPHLEHYTLAHVLLRAAELWPDKVAVQVGDEDPMTYAELLRDATRFAQALETGAPESRHVGLLMPNSARFLVGLYGAALASRTAVLLNPRLRDAEIVYQVRQSDVDVLIAGDAPRRPVASVLDAIAVAGATPLIVWADDSPEPAGVPWLAWLSGAGRAPAELPGRDDTAAIIYTSGSTALPKGVMLAHHSVVHNAELVAARFGASTSDRVFSAGPFFHSGGLTMHVVLSALCGASAYSVRNFEPTEVIDIIEREQITIYSGIETLFLRLTDAERFRRDRLRSVRTGWATGTPGILTAIADDVGIAGVIGVYGISEAGPNVTMSPWQDSREHRLGTIGVPQPDTEVALVDPATGERVPVGSPGELVVRGYGVMQGYYNKPDETAESLRDGWLHTGDLAIERPDGYLTFAGRIKDIVRAGGENVSCAEVENAIYALGGIELAAVIPVEDQAHGQIVVAAVKLVRAEDFSERDLKEKLRATLAGYKVPKHIVHLDMLPMTASGKVQKRHLAEVVEPMLRAL